MSIFQFSAPADWPNYRNIDANLNIDQLNFGVDDVDEDGSDGPDMNSQKD